MSKYRFTMRRTITDPEERRQRFQRLNEIMMRPDDPVSPQRETTAEDQAKWDKLVAEVLALWEQEKGKESENPSL